MRGPADESGGTAREDLAENQPVEEFSQRRELLFDGGGGDLGYPAFHPGGDVDGFDAGELRDACFFLAPGEEASAGPGVGRSGVGIADLGGEELEESFGGAWPVLADQVRNEIAMGWEAGRDGQRGRPGCLVRKADRGVARVG